MYKLGGCGRSALKGEIGPTEVLDDEDALKPDSGTEADFKVENNKFAFSPGQLAKLNNLKSLSAFYVLGGLDGLEKGLRTDRKAGLSIEEQYLDGTVTFEEATMPSQTSPMYSANEAVSNDTSQASGLNAFADRIRVFVDNRLPERKPKNIFQLAWMVYNNKVLLLMTAVAVISLTLRLYQTFDVKHEKNGPKIQWIEGAAIIAATSIVVIVSAANDWNKERPLVRLNKKKYDRQIKVICSGRTQYVLVHDIVVGDVVTLEPKDTIPVNSILIQGHGIKCDESSATGESDLLNKTPGGEAFRTIEKYENLRADRLRTMVNDIDLSQAVFTNVFRRIIFLAFDGNLDPLSQNGNNTQTSMFLADLFLLGIRHSSFSTV
jgi:Ca2+-transporting ATPase